MRIRASWVQHGAIAILGRYRDVMAILGTLSRFAATTTGAEIAQPCPRECYQSWGLLETPHRLLNLFLPVLPVFWPTAAGDRGVP